MIVSKCKEVCIEYSAKWHFISMELHICRSVSLYISIFENVLCAMKICDANSGFNSYIPAYFLSFEDFF